MTAHLERWTPQILSVLRMTTGLLLLSHGTAKLFGIPAFPGFANLQLTSIFGIAGFFELIGGALLLIGLFTRPVAFIMSGFAAVAFFYGHIGRSIIPLMNGGEVVYLLCFICLYLACAGAGPWSADAAITRK